MFQVLQTSFDIKSIYICQIFIVFFSKLCTGFSSPSSSPFFMLRCKVEDRPDPWLNPHTRAIRRESRKHERQWKKDPTQPSFLLLKDAWGRYQRSVMMARSEFYSTIVNKHPGNQRVLFFHDQHFPVTYCPSG